MQSALARSVRRSLAQPAERQHTATDENSDSAALADSPSPHTPGTEVSATSLRIQESDAHDSQALFSDSESSHAGSPRKRARSEHNITTAQTSSPNLPTSPSGSPRAKVLQQYYKTSALNTPSDERVSPLEHQKQQLQLPGVPGRYFIVFDASSTPKARTKRLLSAPSIMLQTSPTPTPSSQAYYQYSPRRLDGISQWTAPDMFAAAAASSLPGPTPPRAVPGTRSISMSQASYGQRIRVLLLVSEERPYTKLIRDFKRAYNEVLEGRCDFIIQEVLNDAHIRGHVLRYNPTVIVTTGTHWMQMVLSGLVEERRIHDQKLQNVEVLHGQLLQVQVCGAVRYLFPLVGFAARRGSSSGTPDMSPRKCAPVSRRNSAEDCTGASRCRRVSPSARRNLTELFMQDDMVMTEESASQPATIPSSSSSDSSATSPRTTAEVAHNNVLDPSTDADLGNLMLFLSEQVSAMTPPGGSPSSVYETFYGSRRSATPSESLAPFVQQQQGKTGGT